MSEITDDMNFHQMVLDKTQDRQHIHIEAEAGKDSESRQKMLTKVDLVIRDLLADGPFVPSQCLKTEIK